MILIKIILVVAIVYIADMSGWLKGEADGFAEANEILLDHIKQSNEKANETVQDNL